MLDILSEYLDTATTLEEKNHIALADRVLVRMQDDHYEHVIEEILMTDQDMDSGTVVPNIAAVYHNQLHDFFALHGITLVEGLSLKQLAGLADGVLDLDNHENPQAMFALIEENAPVLEQVCVMLSQTTQYNADELMHMVEDVADGFIGRLKETTHVLQHEEENDLVNSRERMHAYHKYVIYLEATNTFAPRIDSLLRQGIGPAMPFMLYAKQIDARDPMEVMPPKEVARELFGAALVSDDGFNSPADTIKLHLEQFISEPKTVGNVMVEVRQIMMGYKP